MLTPRWIWRRRPTTQATIDALEHHLGITALSARLLAARGIEDPDQADIFLRKRLADLHRPQLLHRMDTAAQRFATAINERQKILIHGDFDVDGSTATTLMKRFCQSCGHDAVAWIPHRITDGYGMSESSLEAVREHHAQLLITVDCGIVDHGYAQRIENELNCDVIITDHHLPQDQLPQCTAVINPNQPACSYPDRGLAGVGIAWKLCWATAVELCGSERVTDRLREFLLQGLDLVAIGTIADCAPLDGENRILVHHGLEALRDTNNHGLRAILDHCKLNGTISPSAVGWKIGPLLNASGRLSSALRNIELLTSDNATTAQEILSDVVAENDERRRLSQDLSTDLIAEAETNERYHQRRSLVFAGEQWHPGIVGIVASRLSERFAKPSCVIAIDDNGSGRGSLRTPSGIHLAQAIESCSEYLVKGGGHAAAAGITIRADQVDAFSDAFERHIANQNPGGLEQPSIDHDGVVTNDDLDRDFFHELAQLEPFGTANPEPILELRDAAFVTRPELFGKNGDHIRGALTGPNGGMLPITLWKAREHFQTLAQPGQRIHFLIKPELNRWRGSVQPRLVFVDGSTS